MNTLTKRALLLGIGTFHGWLLRKALTLGSVMAASMSAYLAGNLALLQQFASLNGVSHDTLAQLGSSGESAVLALGGFLSAVVLAAGEAVLSRAAAVVAEKPITPAAIPVTDGETLD